MDLLATVRKEGSRGGRADFKWSDVQASSHRENYLGHSLMAPVGRWQKGRDLNWYAKGDQDAKDNPDEDPAAKAARERKEEIKRVKEAEEDALARALGLPVAPRNNPNMEELGGQREVGRVLKEAAGDNDAASSRGVGYGRLAGIDNPKMDGTSTERIEGTSGSNDNELQHALREYKRRHGEQKSHGGRRRRSRSRSHDREHRHKRRSEGDRHRESHRDTERHGGQRSRRRRSFSPERRDRERSRSPRSGRQEEHGHRDRVRHRPSERQSREARGRHDDRRRHDRD
ncbi:hypothetical protein LTR84_008123 [Exophiala bonariae]|uniref:Multiple myeloma tumor-associated protein 2-like N-terminal domain-containing protein n=1 Tax=Exophiala bonariae TaxID=1690606 RepID=A0AAV9NQK0_9EURO|nr:hypothetical protein LTR84_008123 [Exophiala bonariae]